MSEAPDWISLRVMCVDEDKGYGRLLDRIFRNLGVRDITLATSVEEAGLGFDDAPYNFIFVSRTDENSLGTTLTTYLRDKKVTPAPTFRSSGWLTKGHWT